MLDRIDQWLLIRFDLFVGWNRDRGASSQWNLARAACDACVAVNFAGLVMLHHIGTDTLNLVGRIGLLVAMACSAFVLRRSVTRHERMKDGAMRARTVERPVRRVLIILVAAMALSTLEEFTVDDVAVAISLLLLVSSMYLKAAVPPPPADRTELKPRLAST